MNIYSRSHLSDSTLLSVLNAHLSTEQCALAEVLADLAEVDERKLYLPAGFPSMFAWCVGTLHFSEEAAYKRIHAARAARRFPSLLVAVAAGRIHLSAVVMLAPHLREDTVESLIEAGSHRTKSALERLLAERFPRPDVPTRIRALEPGPPSGLLLEQHAPGHVESGGESAPARMDAPAEHAPGRVESCVEPTPGRVEPTLPRSLVAPLAPERYALQVTIRRRTHENLRRAQELGLTSDVAEILDQALALYVRHLEKRKFADTTQPRRGSRRPNGDTRHIPAEVRRAVWKRDGGRCTFVGQSGRRCDARKFVEFDHVQEFARGGRATVAGMRLRCRAHNQYGAEQTFGAEFMRQKREHAQRAAAETKRARAVAAEASEQVADGEARAKRGAMLPADHRPVGEQVADSAASLTPHHRPVGVGGGFEVGRYSNSV